MTQQEIFSIILKTVENINIDFHEMVEDDFELFYLSFHSDGFDCYVEYLGYKIEIIDWYDEEDNLIDFKKYIIKEIMKINETISNFHSIITNK